MERYDPEKLILSKPATALLRGSSHLIEGYILMLQ
jgi:hypothetical protein